MLYKLVLTTPLLVAVPTTHHVFSSNYATKPKLRPVTLLVTIVDILY